MPIKVLSTLRPSNSFNLLRTNCWNAHKLLEFEIVRHFGNFCSLKALFAAFYGSTGIYLVVVIYFKDG